MHPRNPLSRRNFMEMACASAGMASLPSVGAQVMRCATAFSDDVFHTRNLQAFAKAWEAETNAEFSVKVYSNSSLQPMDRILPALQAGEIEMGEVFMSAYAEKYPLLNFDALPFLVRNYADARLMWKISRPGIEKAMEEQGLRVLYAVPWPAQLLLSANRINRLADFSGLRLRANNRTSARFAELSRAKPLSISATALTDAVRDKQFDCMFTSTVTAVDSKSWSNMRFLYDLNSWIPKNMLCMGSKTFARLSPKAKESLAALAVKAENDGWKLAEAADIQSRKELASHNVAFEQPSFELRRDLAKLGEKMSVEWTTKAGLDVTLLLSDYLRQRA